MRIGPSLRWSAAVAVTSLWLGSIVAPVGASESPFETTSSVGDALVLDKVVVRSLRERLDRSGMLADLLQKTEVVDAAAIERKGADTLSQVLDEEPGIRISNECSMCGIKRAMINGLKGEHTTVLVDGVPMHSVVSSFYGLDAVGSAGVAEVEIARGSGASLTAPEAIGGTVNVVTKKAVRDEVQASTAFGEHGYRKTAVVATGVSDDGRTRVTVAGQRDEQDQFDGDGNGVSENPRRTTDGHLVYLSTELDERDGLELRLASFRSKVYGGVVGLDAATAIASVGDGETPSDELFVGGDVRNRYVGSPWQTTESIDTERDEYMLRFVRALDDVRNLRLTASWIDHGQDSFYEGTDYRNDDGVGYADLRFDRRTAGGHLISYGVDYHREMMSSESAALDALQALDPTFRGDSFDRTMVGLYLQDVFRPHRKVELSLAVRFDGVTVDYTDQSERGDELDERLLSPRLHLRWDHDGTWTSRFSAGKGYRAPLGFFESDHGILDDGFQVAIDALEESRSFGYSISHDEGRFSATLSLARTEVDNLAYIDGDSFARPTLVNSREQVTVGTYDLVVGYDVTPTATVGLSYETFDFGDSYKRTFSIAPIEDRARLTYRQARGAWRFSTALTWVGSRNLAEYGYGDRYNTFVDGNDNGTADPGELSNPKTTTAPSYVTVDLRVERYLSSSHRAFVAVDNLTDRNQAKDGDSPLFYDADGGYDVGHIYMPLRGRVVYAGFSIAF